MLAESARYPPTSLGENKRLALEMSSPRSAYTQTFVNGDESIKQPPSRKKTRGVERARRGGKCSSPVCCLVCIFLPSRGCHPGPRTHLVEPLAAACLPSCESLCKLCCPACRQPTTARCLFRHVFLAPPPGWPWRSLDRQLSACHPSPPWAETLDAVRPCVAPEVSLPNQICASAVLAVLVRKRNTP